MANIFHVNEFANRVKRVLKTQVSIESRVFKTRDAIIINSFKTGQLTILLDTHCYLARGFLLSEVNSTLIALVPKVLKPSNVAEFRPIAYCNIIYKCIKKSLLMD